MRHRTSTSPHASICGSAARQTVSMQTRMTCRTLSLYHIQQLVVVCPGSACLFQIVVLLLLLLESLESLFLCFDDGARLL